MAACPCEQAIKALVDFFKANSDANGQLKDGELKAKLDSAEFKAKMAECKAKMKAGDCCDGMSDIDRFGFMVAAKIKCVYEGKEMCKK